MPYEDTAGMTIYQGGGELLVSGFTKASCKWLNPLCLWRSSSFNEAAPCIAAHRRYQLRMNNKTPTGSIRLIDNDHIEGNINVILGA